MKENRFKQHTNRFIKEHFTDSLYRKITNELSHAKDIKKRGRKIELTAEKLHNFLFYLSVGFNYKEAAGLAYIAESTRQKYMNNSETFQRVSSLAKNNLAMVSHITLSKAIEGRPPGYYAFTNPNTHETTYLLLHEIKSDVRTAMWYLDKIKYFDNSNKSTNVSQLGIPRNEKEAELLEMLLKKHCGSK